MLILVSTLGFSGSVLAHKDDIADHCAVVYEEITTEEIFTNALKAAVDNI